MAIQMEKKYYSDINRCCKTMSTDNGIYIYIFKKNTFWLLKKGIIVELSTLLQCVLKRVERCYSSKVNK